MLHYPLHGGQFRPPLGASPLLLPPGHLLPQQGSSSPEGMSSAHSPLLLTECSDPSSRSSSLAMGQEMGMVRVMSKRTNQAE